jgi:hypothetical protein
MATGEHMPVDLNLSEEIAINVEKVINVIA